MKILSIHWGFSLGGVGKYALLIDSASQYEPISIDSLCILNKSWQCDEKGLEKLSAEKIYINSRMDFSWIYHLIKHIKKESPDMIMTHGFNGHFAALFSKIVLRHRIPLICSYHGLYHATTRSRYLIEKLINNFAEYFIRTKAVAAISVAEFSKDYLVHKKVSSEKITVIHNGIEQESPGNDARNRIRNEWKVEEDVTLIGTASRLDPVKGLDYLVNAFEKISTKHEKAQLVIIGTGKCEDELKAQVKRCGLEKKVIFTGFRSDIIDCLEAFDIFALPSLAEYHSIALLEAMRAGKAIVATDVGGNTESTRHEKEGLIVLSSNPDGLEKSIKKYLSDPDFAKQMGKNAKKRFNENFTVDIMVQKTAAWFMRCGGTK